MYEHGCFNKLFLIQGIGKRIGASFTIYGSFNSGKAHGEYLEEWDDKEYNEYRGLFGTKKDDTKCSKGHEMKIFNAGSGNEDKICRKCNKEIGKVA